MKQKEISLNSLLIDTDRFLLTDEEIGDNHVATSIETPMREDAFDLSDSEKIAIIESHFREIMLTLGLDLTDDSLRGTPKRVAKMYIEEIFEENLKLDFIQGRVKYLRKYTHRFYKDSRKQYLYAIILFTLFVENVSLFSQFYVINWFARFKNVLKDTDQQVKYTRNEENIHALVGMKIINTIREEHPELFDEELEERIASEALEAFKAEKKINKWMVNGIVEENLSSDILDELNKKRINDSLVEIGFKKVFEVDETLVSKTRWFYEELLGNNMTDFFHSRDVGYAKKNQSFEEDELF
jgi:ribonucleoside-diphosphate reductase beta chain